MNAGNGRAGTRRARPTRNKLRGNECRIGVWNVRGICNETKRVEVVHKFKKGKFDLLGLCETNLRGNEEFEWNGVHGFRSGMKERERGKAQKGVAVLMTDKWYKSLVNVEYKSARVLLAKFKFARVKVCVIVVYGPVNGASEYERESFWNEVERTVDEVGSSYRVIVMGDMNGWVGDVECEGIIGKHGVPGVNDNGERVVDFCAEKEFCIGNTYFEHKNIHKYTRIGKARDREVRSMIDLILVKRDMLKYLCDVKVVRGLSGDLSDHLIVLCKIRLIGTWMERKERNRKGERIRSERLKNEEYKREYKQAIENKSGRVHGELDVEIMWEQVKSIIVESAREVCGTARPGCKRKGSEWYNSAVGEIIEKKTEAYIRKEQEQNAEKRVRLKEEYDIAKKVAKRDVERCKIEANERLGRKMNDDLNGNVKLFWKEVRKANGSTKSGCKRIKGRDGSMLIEEDDVKNRWREYFESLFNVRANADINVNMCGFGGVRRSLYLGRECISKDEVTRAMRKLKNGKASCVDEVTAEMLKGGS